MKKCYIDMLKNEKNEIAFMIRMKGITSDVIVKKANEMFKDSIQCEYRDGLVYPEKICSDGIYSIVKLYEYLYNGNPIEFDLVESSRPSFEMYLDKVVTRQHFIRKIQI